MSLASQHSSLWCTRRKPPHRHAQNREYVNRTPATGTALWGLAFKPNTDELRDAGPGWSIFRSGACRGKREGSKVGLQIARTSLRRGEADAAKLVEYFDQQVGETLIFKADIEQALA